MEKRIKNLTTATPDQDESSPRETQVFLFSAGVVTFDDPPQSLKEERRLKEQIQKSILE